MDSNLWEKKGQLILKLYIYTHMHTHTRVCVWIYKLYISIHSMYITYFIHTHTYCFQGCRWPLLSGFYIADVCDRESRECCISGGTGDLAVRGMIDQHFRNVSQFTKGILKNSDLKTKLCSPQATDLIVTKLGWGLYMYNLQNI